MGTAPEVLEVVSRWVEAGVLKITNIIDGVWASDFRVPLTAVVCAFLNDRCGPCEGNGSRAGKREDKSRELHGVK